jgi:hypothetical protein
LVSGKKKSSHRSCFAQTLIISSHAHTLVSPSCDSCETETNTKYNQLGSAIQIYIYITQEAIKLENKQNKTAMIISQVASESIRNMNETEDSNKKRNKNTQNDETTPKYVGYDENKLQEMKTKARK